MADAPLFRVHRSAILPALEAVSEGLASRATIPILANILITPRDGRLMLRGTDLTIEIEASCELLEQETQEPLTIDGTDLRNIARNLPESAEIAFHAGAFSGQVRIQSGRSRFSLLTLPETDFPSIAGDLDGTVMSVAIAPLVDAFAKVAYAVSREEARYYLNGVFLHPHEGNRISVAATDGHNLAVARLDAGCEVDFPAAIVPPKTAKAVRKLFGDAKGDMEITVSEALIRFVANGATITSKLVDGTYPDYQRVIPARGNSAVIAPLAALTSAVARVGLVAKDKERDTVRLRVEPGMMKISVKTAAGEDADEDIAVDYDGAPVEIGFSGAYLKALLSSIGTQDVEMHFPDAELPGIFHPATDCDEQYVLMPKRF